MVLFAYDGVKNVLLMRQVLQVANTIVRATAVYVVRLFTGRAGTEESRRYKTMNLARGINPVPRHDNLKIAAIQRRFQDATSLTPRAHALHSSEIGDSVVALKPDNVAPLFGLKFFGSKFLNHRVASLTGCVGGRIGGCRTRSPFLNITQEAIICG